MKILVCISHVPDTTSKINFTEENTKFDSNGVQFVINPNDEFGLTRAMWFKEKQGAEVTVVNVGTSETEPTLRKALAIGADGAIRINTPATNSFSVLYTEEQKKYLKNNLKSLPNLKWIFKNLFKFERNESIVHFDNKKSKRANPTYHTNNFNTFKGWMCDIELENIYIHWNGVLQGSCGQKLFDKEYNMYARDFIENFNPVPTTLVCERDCCFCQPETHISKFSFS